MNRQDGAREVQPCVIEALEPRQHFNIYSWLIAVAVGNYNPQNVMSQPGGYDPKISLLPFGDK